MCYAALSPDAVRSEVTRLYLACRTVRQAGRLPELAMTTGRMGVNLAELADKTAEPTVSHSRRPLH